MNKKDKEKLRQLLLDEKRKILEHLLQREEDSDIALAELKGDETDLASIGISQASITKLGDRERKYLNKVEYALKKFEEGTYGVCELTGEEIPIARLMARPVARYTVEAQEELERQEKGFRDADEVDDDLLFSSSEEEGE